MNHTNRKQADDLKHRLRQQGLTIKAWAELHGYTLRQVSDVVRGINQANYGKGREIAEKLGLMNEDECRSSENLTATLTATNNELSQFATN